MNAQLQASMNQFIHNTNEKIISLIREKEQMMKDFQKADEIVHAFESCFPKLKLKDIDEIHVRENRITLNVSTLPSFKYYTFRGYDKHGASLNKKRMSEKAEKLATTISTILKDYDVNCMVNEFSLEVHRDDEPRFLIITLTF